MTVQWTVLLFDCFIKVLSAFHFCNTLMLLLFRRSVVLTLCDPMDCSTPGFPVLHCLLEFAQAHVHWVSDAIQPSHPLSSPCLPASVFPCVKVFSSKSALRIRWPKYWSFSFSISPSNEYSGFISFRNDWFDLLAVLSNITVQKHQLLVLSLLYGPALMITGKTIVDLTRWTFVGKVMSLLFNRFSRFVIAFLPRSKHLFTSCLQSPSAVNLEPKKIKSVTVSIVSPSMCHEVMGLDATIFVLLMLSFKPAFSLSSFTFIKRLFKKKKKRSSLVRLRFLSFRVVSSAYLGYRCIVDRNLNSGARLLCLES